MPSVNQDAVCQFARRILAARTGEHMEVTHRPEMVDRNSETVEELWASEHHHYAVEHTRLESFAGQIANQELMRRLMLPVREALASVLPGSHVVAVRASETKAARIKYGYAHREIIRLALDAATSLKDGDTVFLQATTLPFSVALHRRSGEGSHVALHCDIEGDGDELRLDRMRRALDAKCPKLAKWAGNSRKSVLLLEADDIQHSNVSVAFAAFGRAIRERSDQPDIVIFVETDASPMHGWMFKEGDRLGDDIPMPPGSHSYTEWQFR
jgi:hypothetical protein